MSSNGVPEKVKQVRDDAMATAHDAYNKADKARKDAVKQLFETADHLREQAREVSGEARENVDKIAHNLERTANYLNSRAVDQVEQTTETMQENMWKSLLAILFVGLLAGWWLGRR